LLAPDTFSALGALRLNAVVGGRLQLRLDGEANHDGLRLREAFAARASDRPGYGLDDVAPASRPRPAVASW
jgi:hypothetical protein